MLKLQIDNRKGFQAYLIAGMTLTTLGSLIGLLYVRSSLLKEWSFQDVVFPFIGLIVILLALVLFEFIIKPAFIETIVGEDEIIIRTFRPKLKNVLKFILMLDYGTHLKELKMSKQEFNDYKLIINRFGFQKHLILQKVDRDGIYEISEINLSLLGSRKYTHLILSIDRLKTKINLK